MEFVNTTHGIDIAGMIVQDAHFIVWQKPDFCIFLWKIFLHHRESVHIVHRNMMRQFFIIVAIYNSHVFIIIKNTFRFPGQWNFLRQFWFLRSFKDCDLRIPICYHAVIWHKIKLWNHHIRKWICRYDSVDFIFAYRTEVVKCNCRFYISIIDIQHRHCKFDGIVRQCNRNRISTILSINSSIYQLFSIFVIHYKIRIGLISH